MYLGVFEILCMSLLLIREQHKNETENQCVKTNFKMGFFFSSFEKRRISICFFLLLLLLYILFFYDALISATSICI